MTSQNNMNHKLGRLIIGIVLILLCVQIYAQETYVKIRFEDHLFQLKEVNDATDLPEIGNEPDIKLFQEHFITEDYQRYRDFYYQKSCHATEDDFNNWREFVQGATIEIVGRYLLQSPKYTLSIIQYKMGNDGMYIYGPLTFQKINNHWYLLNLKESMELMEVKGFFSYIKPEIFAGANDPASWSQQPNYNQLVSDGGVIDGKKLFGLYPARYDSDNSAQELSKSLFYNVSDIDVQKTNDLIRDFEQLAANYNISVKTKAMVERMCKEGNFSLAIETIFQESNADNIIEVTKKLNNIMSN